jgi:hypothetical protein
MAFNLVPLNNNLFYCFHVAASPDTDAGSTMREFEELNKTFKS